MNKQYAGFIETATTACWRCDQSLRNPLQTHAACAWKWILWKIQ